MVQAHAAATVLAPSEVRPERAPLSSWAALAVLLAVGVYALIDRQVFVLFAEAIRKDMRLSDTQLGTLQGVGLSLVGLVTTYPIAWVADRVDRRLVAAACVLVWSFAVAACGLAPGFGLLLAGASFVAVGEAGLSPAAFAMIPDLFPLAQRQLANSIFAIAGRLTGAAGVFFAGQLVGVVQAARPHLPAGVAALPDWRLAFIAAAAFMPVAVALLLLLPRRASGLKPGGAEIRRQAAAVDGGAQGVIPFLRRNAWPQLGFQLAALLMAFGFGTSSLWIPVSAQRYFGQTTAQMGTALASLGAVTGVIGFAVGTPLLAWLQPRFGLRAPLLMLAATVLLCALATAPIAFGSSAGQLYLLWGLQVAVGMIPSMVLSTVLQNMTPAHLRARIFSIMTLVGLVAYGLSPVAVGFISDHMSGAAHPLLIASTAVAVVALTLSGLTFWSILPAYARLAQKVAV